MAFPPDSPRAGVLGQATFLSVTGKPADSSPTERGLFIREHFLCQIVPPPPPGVNTTLPPLTDEKPLNNRQRLQAHLANPTCSGCHRLIDPIGFGFENFDAIGRFRDKQVIRIYPTFDEMKNKTKTSPTEHKLDIDVPVSSRGCRTRNSSRRKRRAAFSLPIPAARNASSKCCSATPWEGRKQRPIRRRSKRRSGSFAPPNFVLRTL